MSDARALLGFLAGLLVLIGALACDDGGGGSGATPTQVATEEATEAATDEPTAGPTGPDESGAQPYDSYHYTVDFDLTISAPGEPGSPLSINIEGDFASPDSHAFTSRFDVGGLSGTEEVVIIEDDAWTREGQGEWESTARAALDQGTTDLTSADPEFFSTDTQFQDDIAVLDSEADTVNGVATRRYEVPRGSLDTLVHLFGDGGIGNGEDLNGLQDFEMTVWLDEEHDAIVRVVFAGTASPEFLGAEAGVDIAPNAVVEFSMTVDLTQANDPGIAIEPPI